MALNLTLCNTCAKNNGFCAAWRGSANSERQVENAWCLTTDPNDKNARLKIQIHGNNHCHIMSALHYNEPAPDQPVQFPRTAHYLAISDEEGFFQTRKCPDPSDGWKPGHWEHLIAVCPALQTWSSTWAIQLVRSKLPLYIGNVTCLWWLNASRSVQPGPKVEDPWSWIPNAYFWRVQQHTNEVFWAVSRANPIWRRKMVC